MLTLETPQTTRRPVTHQCTKDCSHERTHAVNVAKVLGYEFDPLVHRMIDKYGWSETDARAGFEATKQYLALAAKTGAPLIPSPKVDEVWHNFILFTEDYGKFCQDHFGRFINHRPRRRDDSPIGTGFTVRDTLTLAQKEFGVLSPMWDYPGMLATAGCTCSNWCQCS